MTAPLVPADVNLRDFAYMPLDVVRLRDSEIVSHASGEGFRCAVLLWCVSWHQTPAGSLPNDDKALASYVGYGRTPKEWKKVREEALHGWILCDDGRLYHPVVAEKANEAWTERLRNRWRKECDRIKKAAQRAELTPIYPTFDEWLSHYQSTGQARWRPDPVPGTDGGLSLGTVPGDTNHRPEDVTRDEGIKGREGKGREALRAKAFAPPADPPLPARAGENPPSRLPDGTDPDAWALFEAHHRQLGRWSAARSAKALGDLRIVASRGHDPTAVLNWATTRGLADLVDAAERIAADATKEPTRGTAEPRESLADRNARRAAEILTRTGTPSG
jgi:hypothetical protein